MGWVEEGGINAEVPGRGPGQPGSQVGAGAGLSSAVEKEGEGPRN